MARTKSNIGLNRVLDLIRCGFCIWDREGIVIYSNRCLDKWLNREPPEIIGCHLSEFFIAADHERLQVVLNDLEAGNSRMHIATLRIHNGSTFRVIISPVAVSSHEKQDAGGAAIIVDFGEFRSADAIDTISNTPLPEAMIRVADELRALSRALPP